MHLKNIASNGAGMEPSQRPQRPAHKDDTDDVEDVVSTSSYTGQALRFSGRRRDPIPDTNGN